MENMGDHWEQIITELTQGREMARQLQIHLNTPCSQETREILLQQVVSSYEKALSMLNWSGSSSGIGVDQPAAAAAAVVQPMSAGGGLGIESPPLSGSPCSEDSDRDQDPRDGSKKRKTTLRWTRKVRLSPGTGLECTLDDGFSWRKYGQKDILGAKFPRGYYRCTHRHVQGCLATKQVQKSDEDPMIFEITYRGRHTCAQASKVTNSPFLTPPENQEPNNITLEPQPQQPLDSSYQQHPLELLKLRESLRVVTEDLDIHQKSLPHDQFQFVSALNPDHHHHHHHQNQVFSSSVLSNNNNNTLMHTGSGNFPSTSVTNYFSPSGVMTSFQGSTSTNTTTTNNNNQNFQSSDQPTELNEILSAASAANSPTVNVDFPYGNLDVHEFEQNFTFDNLGYFSSFQPYEK